MFTVRDYKYQSISLLLLIINFYFLFPVITSAFFIILGCLYTLLLPKLKKKLLITFFLFSLLKNNKSNRNIWQHSFVFLVHDCDILKVSDYIRIQRKRKTGEKCVRTKSITILKTLIQTFPNHLWCVILVFFLLPVFFCMWKKLKTIFR